MITYSEFFNNDLFHFKHIMILVVCILVIVFGSVLAVKKIKLETFYKILLGVGIISETLKVISYIVMNASTYNGYLPKTDLPFHLCSIQLIFIAILNFSKNEKLKHSIQAFMVPTCLVGGAAALFLATDSSRNNFVITIQYFLFHVAIVIFAIYLLASKEVTFTFKDYKTCLIMLALMGLFAIYLNSILFYFKPDGDVNSNINFMYVVNPPVDNLPFLNRNHSIVFNTSNGKTYDDCGWLTYFAHYVFLAITCVTITFIKPIIQHIKEKKKA